MADPANGVPTMAKRDNDRELRMECLRLANVHHGHHEAWGETVERAQKYYEFVTGVAMTTEEPAVSVFTVTSGLIHS